MRYEKAAAEVVAFDNSDVITASNCTGETHRWFAQCDTNAHKLAYSCSVTDAQWDPGVPDGPGEM